MYARQKKLLAHPLETAEESQVYITKKLPQHWHNLFRVWFVVISMKNNQVQVCTYDCVYCKSVLHLFL